jgi:hypothetical protein
MASKRKGFDPVDPVDDADESDYVPRQWEDLWRWLLSQPDPAPTDVESSRSADPEAKTPAR